MYNFTEYLLESNKKLNQGPQEVQLSSVEGRNRLKSFQSPLRRTAEKKFASSRSGNTNQSQTIQNLIMENNYWREYFMNKTKGKANKSARYNIFCFVQDLFENNFCTYIFNLVLVRKKYIEINSFLFSHFSLYRAKLYFLVCFSEFNLLYSIFCALSLTEKLIFHL